ncbi:6-carboxytetrahydropterin synthase [bacterium]|nr:6-carboxytetrahydropterin synthase [bacterium]
MYLIRVKDDFSAAHSLRWPDGSAEGLHGHNWLVEAVVACTGVDKSGIALDFTVVGNALHELLGAELDHRNLNMLPGINEPNATSERIARWIFDRLDAALNLPPETAALDSVTVWETPSCGVTYQPAARGRTRR